ncbi:MAG: amidophosphoribosyltransferase [Nitrososphaerota archaeon]|nr:amidophosphoribosyltransferase [Candidatus Bathyarchaeota archaeon]MDW8048244.1 amidophosphoribosyltransferase [Nitrososphaerota archaeon]
MLYTVFTNSSFDDKMLGGLFGVYSRERFRDDLYFGVDYHSHLGTEIGGLAFLDDDIKIIFHDISNSQFKSEFQREYGKISGIMGIGVISNAQEEQPLIFETSIGTYAVCTVGLIRNADLLYRELINSGATFKKSINRDGKVVPNQTEIVGELISRGKNIIDGIERMYEKIDGTISLLVLSKDERSIYASGDMFPLIIGIRGNDVAIASETTSFPNLGFKILKFLDYREIVSISERGLKTRNNMQFKRKFCPFLHVYFGFPTSDYYGINAEIVRERCGGFLAEEDDVEADLVLGIADSGFPHSVGYVKRKIELAEERISAAIKKLKNGELDIEHLEKVVAETFKLIPPLRRPLIKYTPGWGRSYIPPTKEKRELIARYKQIPNPQMIEGKRIILIDDSIRRGTQLRDLLKEKILPYNPKEIHGRIASPPQMYPCIFDLSTRRNDLATCKALAMIENEKDVSKYLDPKSPEYATMVEEIRKQIGFTTLKFQSLRNLVRAVIEAPGNTGLKEEDLCLYCWRGEL